ncbi:MAG: hypothetical protein AABY18_01895 [Candidatus Thermoplasmatota archaeon]
MSLTALDNPDCLGLASMSLVAREPFWDEADLPFRLHGSGVLRIEPSEAFHKQLLAANRDELAVMPDCPDAPGWLVPEGIVARWMSLHLANARLDDLLLSHPLYTHLVKLDGRGRARGGRGRLVQWTPGVPTHAHIQGPEFLEGDRSAPTVNRQREKYRAACQDLLERLHEAFDLVEVELAFAFEAE